MATATYKGEPGGDMVCEVFGLTFPAGQAVNIDVLPFEQQSKLANNQMFNVSGLKKPVRPTPSAAESKADDEN